MDDAAQRSEPLWDDGLFRQHLKHARYRVVDDPSATGAVVDTHTHVHLTAQPAYNLACCAVRKVEWVCNVVDVAEDGPETIGALEGWMQEARGIVEELAPRLGKDPAECPLPKLSIIAGCHPHLASAYDGATEELLRRVLADPRVCAIGEAGLDFYYDKSPREMQVDAFRRQIRLARELDLPLCLHVREAHDLAFRILEEEGWNPAGAVLHCYNLDAWTLAPWLEHDCYVGFDGPVTFKKAEEVREAVRLVPADRLLTETDAPFMTPEPMRGMECTPQHVRYVADRIAQVRGCVDEDERRELFALMVQNAQRLYGRGPRPWQGVEGDV